MSDFLKHFMRAKDSRDSKDGASKDKGNPGEKTLQDQFLTHQRVQVPARVAKETLIEQSKELALALKEHARQYTKNFIDADLTFSQAGNIAEPVQWLAREQPRSKNKLPTTYFRWKLTGAPLILSVRATAGIIEFHLVPDKEVPHITMSEFGSRFRGRFKLVETERGLVWKNGSERLTPTTSCQFVEKLLDELAQTLQNKPKPRPQPIGIENTAAQKLVLEKNNLLFKLLNQQEELKNQLARDLHDSVIADLMMLKRYLSGDRKLSIEENIEIIDEIVLQLRDIVNEYSPRQLQEWGLKVGVEDVLDRISRRTGMDCKLSFEGELPRFPDLVTLHLFRIIQESLNNIEKHAGASEVIVEIKANRIGKSFFSIKDNGRGFDPKAVRLEADGSHSMGLEGMKERVELIRCFYPSSLDIESSEGNGTKVTLSLSVSE